MALAIPLAFAGACATYTVVGLDGGEDASVAVDAPTSPPPRDADLPQDAGADATADAAEAGPCTTCGAECCYAGTAKDHCRFGNVCGACSPVASPCRGDVDCCDAGKCATNANGDAGLCRATCKGRFGLCGSTSECCLGLRCGENGSLTLCQ